MNQKQGKSKSGIIFLIVLVVVVALYFNSKNNVKIKKEDNAVSVTVEMYKEAIHLRNQLGENTPYPEIFLYTEMLKDSKNYSEEEAVEAAGDRYTESEAFVWYAEKEGIAPTEKEISENTDKLVEKQKKADNYDEIEEKCKEEEMSVDDIFRKNEKYYSYELYISAVYDHWKVNYDKAHEGENSIISVYNLEWKDFVKEVISKYSETDEYKAKAKAVKNCEAAYLDDSTIEDMKKAEIYF